MYIRAVLLYAVIYLSFIHTEVVKQILRSGSGGLYTKRIEN